MRHPSPSALALIAVLFAAGFAFAQSAPPSADTYSESSAPNRNFGNQPLLIVSPISRGYLRFDLSAVPTGATVCLSLPLPPRENSTFTNLARTGPNPRSTTTTRLSPAHRLPTATPSQSPPPI
jgi:hypothetical protein